MHHAQQIKFGIARPPQTTINLDCHPHGPRFGLSQFDLFWMQFHNFPLMLSTDSVNFFVHGFGTFHDFAWSGFLRSASATGSSG